MATEGTSYQGGAGGKFRKKPLKKTHTTPYDRPPTPFRNPSWLSKIIVDPASKLVSATAHLFFSSLFRKRLPPGADQEPREIFQEKVILSSEGDQGPKLNDSGKQGIPEKQGLEIKNSGKEMTTIDSGGLSELELMLKQKTFTRSEVDRLTELLHSRNRESNGDGQRSTVFPLQETVSALQGQDDFTRSSLWKARSESHLDDHRIPGHVSTAVVSSKVLEEDVATPAELARAYMGNRSSKVSPSVLGLRSQAPREDSVALCNSPFAPRSPAMSLVQKPSVHGGVFENGFTTPRSQGRSAIYSMARTPYSRIHPTASQKGNGSIYDGRSGPSASSTGFARELVVRSVSKDLALKRRSSVLEEEIGSVGPIRRLRQKTILSTPNNKSSSIARTPFFSRATGIAPSSTLDLSSASKTFLGPEDNGNMPGTSYTPVPSQSKETARKILQQLEKLAPKEKQSDKVTSLSENSPSKLPNMLHGRALRSLEDADSSKIVQGAKCSLTYTQKGLLPDACETSSSQGHKKTEENGSKSFSVSHGSLAYAGTGNGSVVFKDAIPAFPFSGSVKNQVGTQSSKKKWAFPMSAHEDLVELDDKIHSSEAAASAKLVEGKKILETSLVDSKAFPVTEDKTTTLSEFKAPTGSSLFGKPTDLRTSDASIVVENSSGFMFSAASAGCTFLPSVVSTAFTGSIPDKESNVPSLLFRYDTKIDKNVPPYTFSSSPLVGGSFSLKSTVPAEAKQEISSSVAANAYEATETVPKPTNSVNGGVGDIQRPGETVGRQESTFLLSQSTSSLFTAGSKPTFSSLSNGSLNSTTTPLFSTPVPVLSTSSSGSQTVSIPFTGFPFSTMNSTAVASEPTPSTSATSPSLLAPALKFQSTSNNTPSTTTAPTLSLPTSPGFDAGSLFVAPSTYSTVFTTSSSISPGFNAGSLFVPPSTNSTVSTTSSSTDIKVSAEKKTNLSHPPSNPFSAPSFQMTGIGNSIFGFGAGSTSLSSAANISQGSLFGPGSGTAVSTQSVSVFGTSAPSSTLETSGSSPFTGSSSLFGSSASSGPAFGNTTSSGFAFGNNSTSSSSLFSSATSSSSLFGSSATSKDLGSGPSFDLKTSAPSSTGFSFSTQSPAFGSSTGALSSSALFSFSTATQSQPVFGSSVLPFGSAPGCNNGDQMRMAEDSMAEDLVQVGPIPPPSLPVFGQPPILNPSPGTFVFGSIPQSTSSGANPFQFGGQQNQSGVQNPNPFQPSDSLDFGGGSSFSLGSGGGDDKSGRRIIRVKHKSRRK